MDKSIGGIERLTMKGLLIPLSAVVFLFGCANEAVWKKPGGTQAKLDADHYACMKENEYLVEPPETQSPFLQGYYAAQSGVQVNRQGYEACLRARGWTKE
jgi:hypothetical protein